MDGKPGARLKRLAVEYQLRDSSSWYQHLDSGRVRLVVLRRIGRSEGTWERVELEAASLPAVERAYSRECERRAEVMNAQARRRARWGSW